MKDYEDDLYHYWLYGTPIKEDLIEGIDSVITEFYEYLLELENLQTIIVSWEVDGKELKKRRKALERKRKEDVINE